MSSDAGRVQIVCSLEGMGREVEEVGRCEEEKREKRDIRGLC
jgi:hypothetical protein